MHNIAYNSSNFLHRKEEEIVTYTRGGRPLKTLKGNTLIVEELSMEGVTGKIYTKTGTVPRGFFVYRGGEKVTITKEEYDQINKDRYKSKGTP